MKAIVNIQVAAREKCSYLKNTFFETPFKVANITEDKMNHPLHLMLMSSSPGILDGDAYEINIEINENAALHLHTQSYQRIFQMKTTATQTLQVRLSAGSSFCFLPLPVVPHKQSSFINHNHFYLGKGCRFIYGEILTCGRKLNDEAFIFSKYHSISQVFLNNKLVVKENLLIMPSEINVHAIGQLEGYTHQASFIYLEEDIDIKKTQQQLIALLSAETNMQTGVSILSVNGLVVRLMGMGAEQLYDCLQRIHAILPEKPVKTLEYAG